MAVEETAKEQVYRHGEQRWHKTGGERERNWHMGEKLRMQGPEDGSSFRKSSISNSSSSSSSGRRRRTRRRWWRRRRGGRGEEVFLVGMCQHPGETSQLDFQLPLEDVGKNCHRKVSTSTKLENVPFQNDQNFNCRQKCSRDMAHLFPWGFVCEFWLYPWTTTNRSLTKGQRCPYEHCYWT